MKAKPTDVRPPDPAMFGPPEDGTDPPPEPAMFDGGSDDAYAPPPDPAKSLFKPVETETPQAESVGKSARGTGQPGDGLPPGSLPYDLHTTQAQEQRVQDDRGTVTVFLSDLPQK